MLRDLSNTNSYTHTIHFWETLFTQLLPLFRCGSQCMVKSEPSGNALTEKERTLRNPLPRFIYCARRKMTFRSSQRESLLQRQFGGSRLLRRFRGTHKCVSSKAALIILVSSFPVSLLSMLLLYPHTYKYFSKDIDFSYSNILASCFSALIYSFYPLAGHLADTKFSRYKTVLSGLWMLLIGLLLLPLGVLPIAFVATQDHSFAIFVILLICGLVAIVGLALLLVSFVGVKANVIQYGMDQLYDTPTDDQSLYVHWYVWTCYLALLAKNIIVSPFSVGREFTHLMYVLCGVAYGGILLVLIIALIFMHVYRHTFNIEPIRENPYKLVWKVTQYARKHKVPVNRSSFTYCEDEIPSGLNLGKSKYGGPFTTEQVEDVKAFYGILGVLISLGPMYVLRFATNPVLSYISSAETNSNDNNTLNTIAVAGVTLFDANLLYPLLIACCIPIYVLALRPFVMHYIPGMLKRLGIGVFLLLSSLILSFLVETTSHIEEKQLGCIFGNNSTIVYEKNQNIADVKLFIVFLQSTVLAISDMLIYVSLYEFLCSQSPHSMKGVTIGLIFAIEGIFNFVGSAAMEPFSLWHSRSFPSCGMTYYLVHMGVGIVALVAYMWTARKYNYRIRDEICHVQRFVEEYYSKKPERYY